MPIFWCSFFSRARRDGDCLRWRHGGRLFCRRGNTLPTGRDDLAKAPPPSALPSHWINKKPLEKLKLYVQQPSKWPRREAAKEQALVEFEIPPLRNDFDSGDARVALPDEFGWSFNMDRKCELDRRRKAPPQPVQ